MQHFKASLLCAEELELEDTILSNTYEGTKG